MECHWWVLITAHVGKSTRLMDPFGLFFSPRSSHNFTNHYYIHQVLECPRKLVKVRISEL